MKNFTRKLAGLFLALVAGAALASTVTNPPASIRIGQNPAYAAVAVNITRTTIDRHAFEDWSNLNTVDTGFGYSSFDAKATMTNSLTQNHFVGYQSRNIYNGSGNLTNYFHGFDTAMVHNGTGTIAFAAGVHLRDVAGTGPITANYGLYIDAFSRGATRKAIYSDDGNTHYLGGPTGTLSTGAIQATGLNFAVDTPAKTIAYGFGTAGQTQFGSHTFYNGKNGVVAVIDSNGISSNLFMTSATSSGLNFGVDTVGKAISYGFGSAGQTQFGTHTFYNGKAAAVAVIDNTGVAVTGAVSATTTVKFGTYTYSTLPTGVVGAVIYCSNCRKVGEGAGSGTGVMSYYSSAAWRVFSTDAVVTN